MPLKTLKNLSEKSFQGQSKETKQKLKTQQQNKHQTSLKNSTRKLIQHEKSPYKGNKHADSSYCSNFSF